MACNPCAEFCLARLKAFWSLQSLQSNVCGAGHAMHRGPGWCASAATRLSQTCRLKNPCHPCCDLPARRWGLGNLAVMGMKLWAQVKSAAKPTYQHSCVVAHILIDCSQAALTWCLLLSLVVMYNAITGICVLMHSSLFSDFWRCLSHAKHFSF